MVPNSDWMLGTGAYIDDIEKVINEYAINAKSSLNNKIILMLFISLALIILTIIIIYTQTT